MVVLGLDPGSVRIGFGVIKNESGRLIYVTGGLLKINAGPGTNRLGVLESSLEEILRKFRPEKVGVEKLFFVKNQKTALSVAETRGVLINTILKHNVPLVEIAPTEVKSAVTGNGHASKKGVAKMVYAFLRLPPQKLVDDATDALAIAIAVSGKNLPY